MDAPRDATPPGQPGASGADDEPAGAETLPTRITASRVDTVSGHDTNAEPSDEPERLAPNTVVGRYIVLGHLGSGGMGVVYRAYDPDLDRQIALKLVRAAEADADETGQVRSRLLREAQGLAKLSHPNVVAIYDVGLFEDGVFLAMELVAGATLRAWLKTEPSYRDKLRVFIAAGEGLAAAHRADLVHRDFKPDNVIVGEDGRPRVLDFGLVRALHADSEPLAGNDVRPGDSALLRERDSAVEANTAGDAADSRDTPAPLSSGSGISSHAAGGQLSSPLTRVGAVLGTPRYMSPEQCLGHPVDAQSDQFSFCVALYEAVYGKPPFRGKTLAGLRANVCAGKVRPPPTGVRVPTPVRRAILKGLATNPANRHASMADLLIELRRDPWAKRRRIGIGLGALALAGAAALALAQRDGGAERCQLDPEATRALWGGSAERAIGEAFAVSGRSHAAETAKRVAAILRARADDWAAMHRASCEATWLRGTQSEALLDVRSRCLSERRAEQVSLVALLSRPELDAATVDRAVEAAVGLPAIAHCADTEALQSPHLPPPPGAVEEIAALRDRLAKVRVLHLAGDYRAAATEGEALVEAARALDYPPLVGEASYALALALKGQAEFAAAKPAFEQAMETAGNSRDLRTAALAAAQWVFVVGYGLDRADEALAAAAMARVLAAQVPDDVEVQTTVEASLGNALVAAGEYAAAQIDFRSALERANRGWGETDLRAVRLRGNIGLAAAYLGDYDAAADEFAQVNERLRIALGAEHPDVARSASNLGFAQLRLGRFEEGLASCREALRVVELVHGRDSLPVVPPLNCIGQSLTALGQLDAAAEAAERSVRVSVSQLGPTHIQVGKSEYGLGQAYLRQKDYDRALATFGRAAVAYEPDHPDLVWALLGSAQALSALGRDREALAAQERAVELARQRELPSRPDAEAALARALERAGNLRRARAVAKAALAGFDAAGRERERDQIAEWLAAQP